MSKVSYIDNNYELGKAIVEKDYSFLKEKILKQKGQITNYIEHEGNVFGYDVKPNGPLTLLYEEPYYVVKFVFSHIDTLHEEGTEKILEELLFSLKLHIKENKGYYNIRIASHIVDLIKVFNKVFSNSYFCGGTVEELTNKKNIEVKHDDSMKMFFCDKKYIDANKSKLLEITYKSFQSYQGQYHISPITMDKAGLIYRNWINEEFVNFCDHSILVAEYKHEPCGFVTIGEGEWHVEGKLAAVSDKYRGLGTYRNMIGTLINYASDKNKMFISSTQFDNLTVQGAWASLGMKPYYSIYNFHIDNRDKR